MELAEVIRLRRLERGLSQGDIARALGVRPTTVYRWERGQVPDFRNLYRLAEVLELPFGELVRLEAGRRRSGAETVPTEGNRQ